MFLEKLNELFRENWSTFLTAGYLVFRKHFPASAARYLDTSLIDKVKEKSHRKKYQIPKTRAAKKKNLSKL